MKIIAIDLDKTLLNDQGIISSKNMDALNKATLNNHKVVIATGRANFNAKSLLKNKISIPIISSNGATIYDEKDNLISETPIADSVANEIIEYLLNHRMYFEITTRDQIFIPSMEKNN